LADEKTFTESEAHLYFAKQYNMKTWDLLDKSSRTRDEDETMLDYAHASLAHWRVAGSAVNHHRGVWMVARVHTVLGEAEPALRHAQRCLELTQAHADENEEFDLPFAYESMARAHALNGNRAEAQKFIELAQQAGDSIVEEGERRVYFGEFDGGNWYGMR
jgi:hypothetical protein